MQAVATLIASCSSNVVCLPEEIVESVEPPRRNARDENRPASFLNKKNSRISIEFRLIYLGVCAVGSLIKVVRPVGSRKSSTSTRTEGNNFALYKVTIHSRMFFQPSRRISP